VREQLLKILERKVHPSFGAFAEGRLSRAQLLHHYQQEWETYMRDYPRMLATAAAKNPPKDVLDTITRTILEEEQGGLSKTAPHTELFLRSMRAIGFSDLDFAHVSLVSSARAFKDFMEEGDWAVLLVFVDGTPYDRRMLEAAGPPSPEWVAGRVSVHPLARHYGAPPAELESVRVHLTDGPRRRRAAYELVDAHGCDLAKMERALELWSAYRGEIGKDWS
jgi:pyrroloquinoline quinone (PQQ) biosynthesis protein C